MSTKEQYAVIIKNIYIEERIHNWLKTAIESRLQEEEKAYNIRMSKLKDEKNKLEAELIGLGEFPIFQKQPNKSVQKPKQQQK